MWLEEVDRISILIVYSCYIYSYYGLLIIYKYSIGKELKSKSILLPRLWYLATKRNQCALEKFPLPGPGQEI